MTTVTIRIEATSKDPYPRYHGFALDSDLNEDFWISQPENVIGVTPKETYVFTWEKEFDLSPGLHRCTYGNSAYVKVLPYPWHTKILIDGKQVAEGDVGRDQFLTAQFTVEEAPPPVTIPEWLPIAVVLGVTALIFVPLLYSAFQPKA
jgi:hypothetical protein